MTKLFAFLMVASVVFSFWATRVGLWLPVTSKVPISIRQESAPGMPVVNRSGRRRHRTHGYRYGK